MNRDDLLTVMPEDSEQHVQQKHSGSEARGANEVPNPKPQGKLSRLQASFELVQGGFRRIVGFIQTVGFRLCTADEADVHRAIEVQNRCFVRLGDLRH